MAQNSTVHIKLEAWDEAYDDSFMCSQVIQMTSQVGVP